MNFTILSNEISFPDVETADEDGLVAIGGDLSVERLLLAYHQGIFPWYNENEPILWWAPNPRCVLFPEKIIVSKSMKKILKENSFSFRINKNFEEVIINCQQTKRKGVDGTWLNDAMIKSYIQLHQLGFAHSAECWFDNHLVGGLYGIQLKNIFCGESMFSKKSNASKFALIKFSRHLQNKGIRIIDCQIENPHLISMGAEMISRNSFCEYL